MNESASAYVSLGTMAKNQLQFGPGVPGLSVKLIRQGNPHFEDNPISVFQFHAYAPDDSPRRTYGFSHWCEVRARSEQFGNRECAAVYNYCPVENTRPNPYHPGVTFTVHKGWSLGCN